MVADTVEVSGAPEHEGVRVDHPSIVSGIRVLIGKGYGNEHICKVIGCPGSVVDRERQALRKMKAE